MELLEAVNMCLQALGETRVTSTSIRHPTVDQALTSIATKQRAILERGYWFNTTIVKMYPNDEGKVEYPANALAIQDAAGRNRYVMRNLMLFDVINNTEYFTGPVSLVVMYNTDFGDLPECVATVVTYRAMRAMYVGDFGNDSSVSDMMQNEQVAALTMETLHMRNMKHNTRQRRGFRNYMSALQG